MKIKTLNDWVAENYSHDLLSELEVLNDIERITFNNSTRDKVKDIKSRMINKNRPSSDKTEIKKYYYIKYYLTNFLYERPNNFDRLLNIVNEKDVILIEHLKELNK